MAEGKKGFVLYCDLKHTIDHLTDDQAGKLFKHILDYVNDQNPVTEDVITKLAFEPVKQQLKRDLKKWEKFIERQRENGKLGGRPNKPTETQKTQAFSEKPKKPVTVTVTDTVTVKDILPGKDIFNAEIEILKNPIEIERICMASNFSDKKNISDAIHKFHLHLESNDKYPQNKRQIFSGFEKWIINEKKFLKNGTYQQTSSGNGKLGTSEARIKAAEKF